MKQDIRTSKWTPGPWRVYRHSASDIRIVIESDNATCVAYMPNWSAEHDKELLANARLIAQAPRLVEALKRIRDGAEFCECDHSTEDCCLHQHPLDTFCAFCIADSALRDCGVEL